MTFRLKVKGWTDSLTDKDNFPIMVVIYDRKTVAEKELSLYYFSVLFKDIGQLYLTYNYGAECRLTNMSNVWNEILLFTAIMNMNYYDIHDFNTNYKERPDKCTLLRLSYRREIFDVVFLYNAEQDLNDYRFDNVF